MKKIFLLFSLLILVFTIHARQSYQDVVYLKNGSIIRGVIVELVPDHTLKIETADKSLLVFDFDEVILLTREPITSENGNDSRNNSYKKTNGHIEVGYVFNNLTSELNSFSLNVSTQHNFGHHFSLGGGVGFRKISEIDGYYMPFFLDLKSHFLKTKVTPLANLKIGYSFAPQNSFNRVGYMVNPNIGVNFKLDRTSSLFLNFGYEFQNFEVGENLYEDVLLEGYKVSFGVSF